VVRDPMQTAEELKGHTGTEALGIRVTSEGLWRHLLQIPRVLERARETANRSCSTAIRLSSGHAPPLKSKSLNSPLGLAKVDQKTDSRATQCGFGITTVGLVCLLVSRAYQPLGEIRCRVTRVS
jgi:hypothetical protein